MVALDIQKAFDSLEWPFLFRALRAFGIGETFITWIKNIYLDATSQVLNNGYTTKGFAIERGVRQGDPVVDTSLSCH